MIVAVPSDTPVTCPNELILAVEASLVLQSPPPVGSDRLVTRPKQIFALPEIAPGNPNIVTEDVATQPVGKV